VARASRTVIYIQVGFGASKANGRGGRDTYKMANLRGLSDKTGNKAKQMTKQANAATLKTPKTRRRSHRLTVVEKGNKSLACIPVR